MKRRSFTAIAIAALLSGMLLWTSSHAFANNLHSLIGKQVAGVTPLYINGIKSAQDAIIIDQTSYIPVRASATLFGYDVDYDGENNRILLNKRPDPEQGKPAEPAQPSQTGNSGQQSAGSGNHSQATKPDDNNSGTGLSGYVGMYHIKEEDILKELEQLEHLNSVYTNLIQGLTQNAIYGYNQQHSELLTTYYTKQSYVRTEMTYLQQILELRKRHKLFE